MSSTFSESHKKWVPEFLFGDVIDISRLKYEITSSRSQDFARGALMMILIYFNCGKLGLTSQTLMYLTISKRIAGHCNDAYWMSVNR